MRQYCHLSPEKQYKVIIRGLEGANISQLQEEFNIGKSTIYRIRKEFQEKGKFDKKTRKRTPIVSQESLSQVENHIKEIDHSATRQELIAVYNLPIKKSTLSKYIHQFPDQFRGRIAPKKTKLTQENRDARIRAAESYQDQPVQKWKDIFVFCDESGIDNGLQNKSRHVFRPLLTNRFDPDYQCPAEPATCRFNFFSWVSSKGVGDLFFYEKMNSEVFCDILPEMVSALKKQFGHEDFKIVIDNAPWHTSYYCKDKIFELGLTKYIIKLPVRSPDINIIENLWGILKTRVRDYMYKNGQIKNKDEFSSYVQFEWQNIEPEIIENLYKSLPNRMREIIKASGQITRY